jgi:hypothetical protein
MQTAVTTPEIPELQTIAEWEIKPAIPESWMCHWTFLDSFRRLSVFHDATLTCIYQKRP